MKNERGSPEPPGPGADEKLGVEEPGPAGPGRFAFGANWLSFVDGSVTERSIGSAVSSLSRLLGQASLEGRTFLDLGCGSGLFSLAACRLGAASVVALDLDPDSVRASELLRSRAGVPAAQWRILQGSILDDGFMGALEPSDIVYSWGVLHHTGNLWVALDRAVGLVKPGGMLAIAIYNTVERRWGGSRTWWRIKRAYTQSPGLIRSLMRTAYVSHFFARHLARGRNPIRLIRKYGDGHHRGMDFWHDVRDWVGGFPYEHATPGEVFGYLNRKHGLQLEYLKTTDGHGCNEFTFVRGMLPDRGASLPAAPGERHGR